MLSTRSFYWIATWALLAALVSVSASGIEEPASGVGAVPSAEPYAFSYSANSVGGYSDRQESGDASGRVQGFYTMMGDDGRMRRVDYVADENGYRAQISTNEMGTRSGPTGDAMYTVSQPSAGQLEAARVSIAEYSALESPHLLAARIGNARMTSAGVDEEAWRSRLQAEPVVQQQQSWRVASRLRAGSLVQDLSTAQETNTAPRAVLSYRQQQQQRIDTRPVTTNNIRANQKVSDFREGMWAEGVEAEQQQQSNVVDAQDQVEITTTTELSAPATEAQLIVKSQPKSVFKAIDQRVQTESPVVSITTVDQEQVDVMTQTATRKAASTTTEQPTTTSTSTATSTIGQEQEQPATTTLDTVNPASPINSQQVTTTTTRQLQRTSSAPSSTQETVATPTSPELTTEPAATTTTTTASAKTTRQPILIIETNRAALREESEEQQQQPMKQTNGIASGSFKGSRFGSNRNPTRNPQQVPFRTQMITQKSQERFERPVLVQVPQVAQASQERREQSFTGLAQGTKGGYSKTSTRQQAFWRARMLRNGLTPDGEPTGFGARTSALN